MRLALVVYDDLQRVSGGFLYDRMLVENLRRMGDEVHIVSIPWRAYARHLSDNTSKDLLEQLSDPSLDLVLQDELNHPSLFWLNHRLHNRRRVPILSIIHHLRSSEAWPPWQRLFFAWVERSYLHTVDGLICNSQNTSRQAHRLADARLASVVSLPGKDHVSPPLTDERIRSRAQESGPLRVLFVGNVIRRKGLHILVDAIASLPKATCRLTVVGSLESDVRYADRVQQQARRRGLEDVVDFQGSLLPSALQATLETHQALVVPSTHEGFGIAYLEAAGFGLPSIASSSGGAGEFVHHCVSGYLLPPVGTPIAEHLLMWHQDRRLLLEMSLAARRAYQDHPTWEQGAARTRRFLQEMSSR